jgi:ABC-2 type transport system ATP-binding protein
MPETVVELRSVVRKFGSLTAVDNLTLDIEKGETFGFLGPNGAGKSTTIKMLTGFLKPNSGTIRIMGLDMARQGMQAKCHIGLVPDEYGLYDDLTAADHLRFYGSLLGLKRSEMASVVEKSLAQVELSEKSNEKAKGFSHGMRQRLVIAQALMAEPDILFLDEPTSALDPIGAREVRNVIKRMAASGMTLFISSHILFEIQEMCKSVGIVQRGRLLKKDSIENLSNFLKEKMGRQLFLAVRDQGPETLKRITSIDGVLSAAPDGAGLRIKIRDAEVQHAIPEALVKSGTRIMAYYELNPSLEEIFMDLVGVGK